MAIGNPSLAARCTSCQTVFRVVPDQLRVSGGWVRCGRCAAVFNAAENLVELDDGVVRRSVRLPGPLLPMPVPDIDTTRNRPAGPGWAPAPEPSGVVATSDGAVAQAWADTDIRDYSAYRDDRDEREDIGFVVDPDEEAPGAATEAPAARIAPGAFEAPAYDEAPADAAESYLTPPQASPSLSPSPLPSALPRSDLPEQADRADWAEQADQTEDSADARQPPLFDSASAEPAAARAPEPPVAVAAAATDALFTAPSFVRSADRAARWQLPQVRAALGGVALLAVCGLVAQVLFEYRDLAAARWPLLRPVLVAFCDVTGCRVEAARSIDGLAVESSGLLRIERSDRYRLSVTLRNRAGIDLALPALDLSLTDGQGKLVARRVLALADIGATQSTLAAGREISLQATLRAAPGGAGEAVAGYTIELFYP